MKKLMLIALAIFLVLGMFGTASANYIQNGSFEDPALAVNWAILDQSLVPNWESWITPSYPDSGIEIQTSALWSPQDGNQYAELAANNPTHLYQVQQPNASASSRPMIFLPSVR